jgi:hypothetical protein
VLEKLGKATFETWEQSVRPWTSCHCRNSIEVPQVSGACCQAERLGEHRRAGRGSLGNAIQRRAPLYLNTSRRPGRARLYRAGEPRIACCAQRAENLTCIMNSLGTHPDSGAAELDSGLSVTFAQHYLPNVSRPRHGHY